MLSDTTSIWKTPARNETQSHRTTKLNVFSEPSANLTKEQRVCKAALCQHVFLISPRPCDAVLIFLYQL